MRCRKVPAAVWSGGGSDSSGTDQWESLFQSSMMAKMEGRGTDQKAIPVVSQIIFTLTMRSVLSWQCWLNFRAIQQAITWWNLQPPNTRYTHILKKTRSWDKRSVIHHENYISRSKESINGLTFFSLERSAKISHLKLEKKDVINSQYHFSLSSVCLFSSLYKVNPKPQLKTILL